MSSSRDTDRDSTSSGGVHFPPFPGLTARTPTVAIFGAGIAGLTAAHELVERGFSVTVYEIAPPSPLEDECSIGGMARTQWSRAARLGLPPFTPSKTFQPTKPLEWHVEEALKQRIRFEKSQALPTPEGEQAIQHLIDVLDSTDARAAGYDTVELEINGFFDEKAPVPSEDPNRLDSRRACYVAARLTAAFPSFVERVHPMGWGYGRSDSWTVPDSERDYVEVRLREDYLPGEHGYRFYPTFYRNLRDTLMRTPIPEERDEFVETSRTVFDNLVATQAQGVNFYCKEPYVLPRKQFTSIQKFFDLLVESLDKSGFSLEDTNRLGVKTFKFLTSCKERRDTYEDISWWDFIGGDDYSEPFRRHVENVAQAFVAMSAKECDARTYGDVSLQLYRDQFYEGERIDAILNGPTSLAWFEPWRRYLVSQGVTFVRASLVDFEVMDEKTMWPRIAVGDDIERYPSCPTQLVEASYYVIALNIEAIHDLLRTTNGRKIEGSDAQRIRDLELGKATDERPDGSLHHLSGIQFFFPAEIKFLPGHTVFPDTPWGLSAIYQPQFWLRKRGWWDGYRGLLSVCIGRWHLADPKLGRSAWKAKLQEIAETTWEHQIVQSIPEHQRDRITKPLFYHLDDNIKLDRSGVPSENLTRMFINLPGHQKLRPGILRRIPEPPLGCPPTVPDGSVDDGYEMCHSRLVFAGTYMQTFTRLTTMEAANESARHAVNAILKASKFRGDRCSIADPEDNEFDDVEYLVDLDRELFRQGLPHMVDILDLRRLTAEILRGEIDLSSFGFLRGAMA